MEKTPAAIMEELLDQLEIKAALKSLTSIIHLDRSHPTTIINYPKKLANTRPIPQLYTKHVLGHYSIIYNYKL